MTTRLLAVLFVSFISACGPGGVSNTCGSCEPWQTCESGSCVGENPCNSENCDDHGTCDASTGNAVCTCNTGYDVTVNCSDCATNFHWNAAGEACTDNPCDPNDCSETNKTVCSANGTSAVCSCNAGFHDESNACVIDEVCLTNSCNQHGDCTVTDGLVVCSNCDSGYTGQYCDDCAPTYHLGSDGITCTQDVCDLVVDPCQEANKGVCTDNAGSPECSCDATYHLGSDGTTCTQDICNQETDPCQESNKGVCADVGGNPVCSCDPTYHLGNDGSTCTQDVCDLVVDPCQEANKGVCTDNAGSPECSCDSGYQDNDVNGSCTANCTTASLTCGTNAACSDLSGTAECVCDPGNQDNDGDGDCSATCATSGLTCDGAGHGSCSDTDGSADCACTDGWTGTLCDQRPYPTVSNVQWVSSGAYNATVPYDVTFDSTEMDSFTLDIISQFTGSSAGPCNELAVPNPTCTVNAGGDIVKIVVTACNESGTQCTVNESGWYTTQ